MQIIAVPDRDTVIGRIFIGTGAVADEREIAGKSGDRGAVLRVDGDMDAVELQRPERPAEQGGADLGGIAFFLVVWQDEDAKIRFVAAIVHGAVFQFGKAEKVVACIDEKAPAVAFGSGQAFKGCIFEEETADFALAVAGG